MYRAPTGSKRDNSSCVRFGTDGRTPTLIYLLHSRKFRSSQGEVRPLIFRLWREGFGGERRLFLRFRDEE